MSVKLLQAFQAVEFQKIGPFLGLTNFVTKWYHKLLPIDIHRSPFPIGFLNWRSRVLVLQVVYKFALQVIEP